MSTVVSKNVQIGADGTASNNFTAYQPTTPDGTLRIGNGNSGSVTDAITLTSAGSVGIGTSSPTNGKLEVTNSSSTVPAGFFRNTSGSGDSPSLTVQGGANNAAPNFSVLDYSGNVDFVVQGTGNVGIGTSSPLSALDVSNSFITVSKGAATTGRIGASDYIVGGTDNDFVVQSSGTGVTRFVQTGSERMRLDNAGNVGIGTSSPNFAISFGTSIGKTIALFENAGGSVYGIGMGGAGSAGDPYRTKIFSNGSERMAFTDAGNVLVGTTTRSNNEKVTIYQSANAVGISVRSNGGPALGNYESSDNGHAAYWTFGRDNATTGNFVFASNGSQKVAIDGGGNLLVGKTSSGLSVAGFEARGNNEVYMVRNGDTPCQINRLTNDGALIGFYQATTLEGTISVSGSTVSYNGGHLSRWAQTTGPKDETLVKGTVLSNLDEMNVYVDADGNAVDNEQLNKVKVSDVEGDANVAGVFVNWTYDEAHQVDEINMAMTGDMIIRIASGTTVARGDLLMSAGDGTAKPQGDDIVRSKTIAKVTSTHVTCTYEDGSFCVPCVLMAC